MYVCMCVCNYVGSVGQMVTSICGGVMNIYIYIYIEPKTGKPELGQKPTETGTGSNV